MPRTPYVGFSNNTLAAQPPLAIGDAIACRHCGGTHVVRGGRDADGQVTDRVLFYTCGDTSYLAGVGGRCVIGVPADVRGQV